MVATAVGRRRARRHHVLGALAVAGALAAGTLVCTEPATASASGAPTSGALSSPRILGWGLNGPTAMAAWGRDLFVANCPTNTSGYLVELDATTGALVRLIVGPGYQFGCPEALAHSGPDLFVANLSGVVTEVYAPTGALLRVISGPEYRFNVPDAIAVAGGDIFVANGYPSGAGPGGYCITELDASTGALVRVISGPKYRFVGPDLIVAGGNDLFIANRAGNGAIDEVDASDGALVRSFMDGGANAMAVDGPYLFAALPGGGPDDWGSLYKVGISTGAVVRVLQGTPYRFYWPDALTVDGPDLFVANLGSAPSNNGSVEELDAATGKLLKVFSGPEYQFHNPVTMALNGADLSVVSSPTGPPQLGWLTVLNTPAGTLLRAGPGSAYGFDVPDALALDGPDLFVVNQGYVETTGSLSELSAATGAPIRLISGAADHFDDPVAVAADGPEVFVADRGTPYYSPDGSPYATPGQLTEVDASSGALARVLGASWRIRDPYQFTTGPDALAASGPDLFVAEESDSVSEVAAATHKLVWLAGPANFDGPVAMVLYGPDLFVVNSASGSVTELGTSTGGLVRAIAGAAYRFDDPVAIARDGGDLFVANSAGESVTELDASTGGLVRVISGPAYGFESPVALAAAGPDIFVVNDPGRHQAGTGSLTEVDAGTGALVTVISGPAYKFDAPDAIVPAGGDLFVANSADDTLTELPQGNEGAST